MDKTMTLKPRISEKSYALSQSNNVYVFQVPSNANRLTVAGAIKAQFDVTVINVNIAVVKGKTKRTVRKGGKQSFGKRVDVKKAYVTLKEGDTIGIFASEDDKKAIDKTKEKSKKATRSTK